MKKNKTLGIVLLVLAGMGILGTVANGTDLSGKNPGYYIGFFGGMGALIVIGLMNLFGKEEQE
jgi:hypothetical protein